MSVVIILMLASLAVGLVFVGAFVWSVRSGQYEDTLTPSMRVLLDDATPQIHSQPLGGARICDPQQSRQSERTCDKVKAPWSLGVAAAEDGRALQTAEGARGSDPRQLRQSERISAKMKAPWGLDVAAAEDGRAPGSGHNRRFKSEHKI